MKTEKNKELKFKQLMFNTSNILNLLNELKNEITEIDKNELEKMIKNGILLRKIHENPSTNFEYLKRLNNLINIYFSSIGEAIQEILLENLKPKNTQENKEKYINGAELSKLFGLTKPAITNLRKQNKFFTNTIQIKKGGALKIPYSDVDQYVMKMTKYKNIWENFKAI